MNDKELDFSKALIHLLKGVINKEDNIILWNQILVQRSRIEDYLSKIGLELELNDIDHYCYVKQSEDDLLPKLTVKRQLNYQTSLLLVLLRKKMADFDSKDHDSKLIVTNEEIYLSMSIFLKDVTNEVKQRNSIDTTIKRVVEIGILRPLNGKKDTYEVLRIIRSIVDGQTLNNYEKKLQEYKEYSEVK